MNKDSNASINFSLKKNASIQIGLYILITAYIIKTILNGFLVDDNPVGMMSSEIIEILCSSLLFFAMLLSLFTIYFKGKRASKKSQNKLWNKKTKQISIKVVMGLMLTFVLSTTLMKMGEIYLITPLLLICYALLLFIVKNKKRNNIITLSLLSILLAITCYFIPSYWYSSLAILGIAQIAYGVVIRD